MRTHADLLQEAPNERYDSNPRPIEKPAREPNPMPEPVSTTRFKDSHLMRVIESNFTKKKATVVTKSLTTTQLDTVFPLLVYLQPVDADLPPYKALSEITGNSRSSIPETARRQIEILKEHHQNSKSVPGLENVTLKTLSDLSRLIDIEHSTESWNLIYFGTMMEAVGICNRYLTGCKEASLGQDAVEQISVLFVSVFICRIRRQ